MTETATGLLLFGGVLGVALAWLVLRAPLRLGGDAAVARAAGGLAHALQAWLRYGPLRAQVERTWEAERAQVEVRLFGWRVLGRDLKSGAAEKATKPEDAPRAARKAGQLRGRVELDWIELVAWILQRRRLLTIDRARGFVRFGLGDPARTGEVSGLLCTVAGLLPPGVVLVHEPVFDREVLEAEVSAALALYPVLFLTGLVWFALTRVRFFIRPRVSGRVGAPGAVQGRLGPSAEGDIHGERDRRAA